MSTINLSYSSVTKKIIMALAGLFLISFLVVHLSINLLMLLNDGGALFTEAVHFMTTNPLIKVFEIVLFGGFLIHILVGIIIQVYNWMARPNRYKVEGFSHTSFFSKYMIHTGAIVFVFLIIHFCKVLQSVWSVGHHRDLGGSKICKGESEIGHVTS